MTKLEAWQKWNESIGMGMAGSAYALEKSSHGKAFSYAWDAAVEDCAEILLDHAGRDDLSDSDQSLLKHLFELIRARGEA